MALATQPTAAPTNKVAAGGISGALAIVLIWLAGQFGIEMTNEVAGAFVLLSSFVSAYIKRDKVV